MDIAEIREKAKLLKHRGEAPSISKDEIQPEPVQQVDLLEDAESQPATDHLPEDEVLSQEEFIDLDDDIRAGEQILKSWEQGLGSAVPENLTPLVSDIQKPEPSVEKKVDESDKEEAASGAVEAIIFSMDKEDYGVDIHQVKEVIKVRELTAVPKAPRDIMGVISLRGAVIPVMNLRGRFGMPMENSGERIIIVRDGAGLLGLLVDSVRHVVRVPENSI